MRNIANPPGLNPGAGNQPGTGSTTSPIQSVEASPAFAHTSRVGPSRLLFAFRIARWSVYGLALILLILLLHKAAPPQVQTNPEAAARAEQKFADVQQAVAQGQPAELRMDETELNSYLLSHLDLADSTASSSQAGGSRNSDAPTSEDIEKMRSNVRDVKVQLLDDRVRAYVVFDVHGKDMTLQLEGKLGADNGFLSFEPVSGQIGALPIPQSTLEATVKKVMESPVNREKLKLPAEVSDLKVENGEVVATYQ
jgi:hypothetical protein